MGKKMKIDFGGVSKEIRAGGSGAHIPEGDYLFKIVSHEVRKSERSGGRYINWLCTVASGEYKGKKVYLNTSLKPDALWNLRNLIHAVTGKNVAGKALDFDPSAIEGKVFAGTTEDNEYTTGEGANKKSKINSQIVDIRPKDELEDDEEEEEDDEVEEEDEDEDDEEEEKPKKKKAKKKKSSDDDDDEDEEIEEVDLDDI